MKNIHNLKSLKKDLKQELKKKEINVHFMEQLDKEFDEIGIRVEYEKGIVLFIDRTGEIIDQMKN